jgi:hypothetical protein
VLYAAWVHPYVLREVIHYGHQQEAFSLMASFSVAVLPNYYVPSMNQAVAIAISTIVICYTCKVKAQLPIKTCGQKETYNIHCRSK